MDTKELNAKINNFFKNLPTLIKEFPEKFKKMSLGEQVAYICILIGVLLVIISLFLF